MRAGRAVGALLLGGVLLALLARVGELEPQPPQAPDDSGQANGAVGAGPDQKLTVEALAGRASSGPGPHSKGPGSESLPSAAPSLAGVEIDGAIRFAADGSLRTDRDLKRLFDFLLTTLGERDLTSIRGELALLAQAAGSEPQAQAVLDQFERYLAYLRAAGTVQEPDLTDRLAALAALRREWLGETMAEGFFGAEERYARATLERAATLDDLSLDAAERSARLAAIDANLDPELVASRERSLAHHDTLLENQAFAELDVDPATRHALRAERYGEAAADRLGALDRSRTTWDTRASEYFDRRAALLADPTLSAADRSAALDALDARFSEPERRRLAAWARIGRTGD